jgi:hypothetical protein
MMPNFSSLTSLRNTAALLGIVVGVTLLYMILWPFRTLEPRVQPYHILTPVVHQGELVIYEANYCKYTTAPALVVRNLESTTGTVIGLPTTSTNLPTGCHIAQSATTVVPTTAPPGTYKIRLTITYRVNALRDITVNLTTDYFNVIKEKP